MESIKVKIWLLKKGYRQAQIATEIPCSRVLVSYTIAGKAKNRKILKWLIDHGCPKEYLDFPKKGAK